MAKFNVVFDLHRDDYLRGDDETFFDESNIKS